MIRSERFCLRLTRDFVLAGMTPVAGSESLIVGHDDDGLPLVRKLGKGGSARLLPLVSADAFAELGAEQADVEDGGLIRYYPFGSSFSLQDVLLSSCACSLSAGRLSRPRL